jgi:hypothetical protein
MSEATFCAHLPPCAPMQGRRFAHAPRSGLARGALVGWGRSQMKDRNMRKQSESSKSATAERKVEVDEEEDETPLLDAVMHDMSAEEIAKMESYLDDPNRAPIGSNIACNGFAKKAPEAELFGRVISSVVRASQFDGEKEDEILFVQGFLQYHTDVTTRAGKLVTKKGRYPGVFGFQLDAGTMALSGTKKGTTLHVKVKDMIDLSGGRTRWTYHFVRVA